ncbi:MAG: MarR family transcriptional regulator [Gemmobacter sp.]|nr:MarR family transcriptional regulator [Gemmobacter sp.]
MAYVLDDQVGFLLRRAQQRHLAIFAAAMPDGLTARQFAALAKLGETGPCTQNALGRATAMDNATISGVLGRLEQRGLVRRTSQEADRRMLEVRLTDDGAALVARCLAVAQDITAQTLAPLNRVEAATLIALLRRLG